MKLPEKIPLATVSAVGGDNGFKQEHFVNYKYGIHCIVTRKDTNAVPVELWTMYALSGRSFDSYIKLREAAMALIEVATDDE